MKPERGQLAYDNPEVAIGISTLYNRKMNAGSISCPRKFKREYIMWRKFKREYIMSGGNLSGVYHFYTMAVTAVTTVYVCVCVQKKIVIE